MGSSSERPDLAGVRVALLAPCFWPEVHRGGERIVRSLADGLLAAGLRPRLITSHPGRPRRAVEDGLPVARHSRPPDGLLVRAGLEDHLTHLPFSYRDLRRGDDDLAHALFPTDGAAAAAWSRRTGRPPRNCGARSGCGRRWSLPRSTSTRSRRGRDATPTQPSCARPRRRRR